MAQTPSAELKVKAFGLAAYLAFESLIDRLIASGTITPNEVQILFLDTLNKCAMHELPASPWQAEASEARIILNKGKADAQSLYGP
jgi:hypothetical protein